MAPSSSGAIVLVPFPFSNLAQSKLRPALVLASASYQDWILCQITSNPFSDPMSVEMLSIDFTKGSLQRTSYARPNKLFTADEQIFVAEVGTISHQKFAEIIARVKKIFDVGLTEYL